jgi:hypothetical protein
VQSLCDTLEAAFSTITESDAIGFFLIMPKGFVQLYVNIENAVSHFFKSNIFRKTVGTSRKPNFQHRIDLKSLDFKSIANI